MCEGRRESGGVCVTGGSVCDRRECVRREEECV